MKEKIKKQLLDNLSDTRFLEEYLYDLRKTNINEAIDACLDLLSSGDVQIQGDAIWFIEMLKPNSDKVIQSLKLLIHNTNLYIRTHSVVFLSERGVKNLINELYDVLHQDIDPQTRSRAASSLLCYEEINKISLLKELLVDSGSSIVWEALIYLKNNPRFLEDSEIRHLFLETE